MTAPPPKKKWYQFQPPINDDWGRLVGGVAGGLGAGLAVYLMPWLGSHWWDIWPWLLVIGLPLVLLYVVVRVIRYAWKGN